MVARIAGDVAHGSDPDVSIEYEERVFAAQDDALMDLVESLVPDDMTLSMEVLATSGVFVFTLTDSKISGNLTLNAMSGDERWEEEVTKSIAEIRAKVQHESRPRC